MESKNQPVELSQSLETASATLAARCYQDAAFAKRLRENPRATIEEVCGKKFPESFTIEVHENDGHTWHVPVPQGASAGKLSDEQLKSVSGGEIVAAVLAIIAATAVTASVVGVAAHLTSPP